MNIVCLLSGGPGHLDFGGMGHLRIVKELQSRGHDIKFITTQYQTNFLSKHQIVSEVFHNINQLWLPEENQHVQYFSDKTKQSIKAIELKLKKYKPDLVIVDRIWGLAAPMLQHLQIPYIVMGSPGGSWVKNDLSIQPGISEHHFNGFREQLVDSFKWKIQDLSCWAESPLLNVCFVGKEFYPNHSKNSAFVNLFSKNTYNKKRKIIISLGSGTFQPKKFAEEISDLLVKLKTHTPIDLYAKEDRIQYFMNELPAESKEMINVIGFKPFIEVLGEVSHIIFAGGISSIWYCLEYGIVPIIVSGNYHDQDYNKQIIQKLNLELEQSEYDNIQIDQTNRIKQLKFKLSFTDTLHTIIEKIERLS